MTKRGANRRQLALTESSRISHGLVTDIFTSDELGEIIGLGAGKLILIADTCEGKVRVFELLSFGADRAGELVGGFILRTQAKSGKINSKIRSNRAAFVRLKDGVQILETTTVHPTEKGIHTVRIARG